VRSREQRATAAVRGVIRYAAACAARRRRSSAALQRCRTKFVLTPRLPLPLMLLFSLIIADS
jgi:hypothetical protein